MMRIAFYGKGGIGKSTIASNVSAALAQQGKRVLHIGCDPKADSTRTLLGRRCQSVLRLLAQKDSPAREEVLHQADCGVFCVESGGPEAGCGCAGLGIITAMDELRRLGIFEEHWDAVVYDVLGDVVCGGFSAPMRERYADRVFIVTSADFMSLYAANNILKGVCRYSDQEHALFGGLIFNHIRGEADLRAAEAFAQRIHGPIAAALPESPAVRRADYLGKLCLECCSEDPVSESLRALAAWIEKNSEEDCGVMPAPMEEDELDVFAKEMGEML